ncbi:nucleoprotein TPR [Rhodotorula toruloides]|uniref:Nucleoprotein TPR n=1 Tax=Rhodotorula toruloides TaxID=5286 RepID=A0A511KL61_RHOTO|nr:nucleoprotein TPR [Rhodotorula toruloides]
MAELAAPAGGDLQQQLESLRAESTRQQLESEQALHDLSSKLSAAEQDLATVRDELACAKTQAEHERAQREEAERRVAQQDERRKGDLDVEGEARKKLEQCERDKRELMEAVEKEQRERASVEESLESLRTSYTALRTTNSELEGQLAEASSTSRTSLLRMQTLQSTVSSLEADKSFLTGELERGRAEWSTYRQEKHEELVQLREQLETKTIEERAAKSSLEGLRKAHEALEKRHEEAIAELANIRGELASSENQFATEMSSMRRLVDLMEKREEERKKRVEDVEKALEEEMGALQEKEEELKDQLLQERERADSLESRNAELREALERGNSFTFANGVRDSSVAPGSPGGSVASGSFALSPSAQLAVRGQKSGRSYAEIYGEYIKMEEELARERAETKRLGEVLTQILGDIEERAPLLHEQRLEYERLSAEATDLASQLAQALTDRDISERRAESLRLDVDRLSTDNTILTQQLSDLGRQLRSLSRVIAAQENPSIQGDVNEFDEDEAAILRRAEEIGDTDSVVSAHLVTFRTVNELQVQNQKLLKITRQMGHQLEQGEQEAAARRQGEENKAVEEAHELILRLKEEIEAQRVRTEAYEKERDMFRRMLAQRGGAGGAAGVATTTNGAGDGFTSDVEASRMLAEVQANFDAYKAEIAIDTQKLRDDLTQAQKDAGTARTELAKSKAQAEHLAERFRLLTESYDLQKTEVSQMSKRNLELQQMLAKRDMATHKMSEDLFELRGTVDQLRHENTNLKSEREILKNVEKRLSDENATLSKERTHLADLMRNLQTMQNELERGSNDARRRLEEQVTRLETQAAELKERLNQEADTNRQLALRKEIESKSFQERIDKLNADYAETREKLVAAETSQQHLEQRVQDLVLQVEAKEEKLAVYEGRSASGETSQSAEEQLQVTVADLRNELRTVKGELERAKEHVKQYQAIAETQGESLREVTATYEEYKASTESAIAEKDSEIASLRERLHSLMTDLTASNAQNSELHRQIEAERVALEKERKTFEDGMAGLRAADEAARQAQLAAQDDMRRQAQAAKDAHDKYERELVAHAEDVKRLTEVKDELERVRATVREHELAAQVARANLTAAEESWARQKTVLERELAEVRKRSNELKEQNSTLAQHLETASAQAVQLQARSAATQDGAVAEEGAAAESVEAITISHSSSVEQLREVIRYLRREKDIIDLQLDFSKQEATRLRQQLDFTSRSLEEARQTLQEERSRVGDALASSAQHAELLESIHTAKLLRESNDTLRDENEANLRKVATLEGQLRTAQAEIEPLKEQVRTLQAELEAAQHQAKLLEEDNERWKTRNQTILAKYERIDPEELQILKSEVAKVQAALATAEAEKDALNTQLAEQTKLAESMRSNWQNGLERFKNLQVQARTTRDERNTLTKTVEELKQQLEAAGGADAIAAAVAEAQAQSKQALDELQARLDAVQAEKTALESRLAESRLAETEQVRGEAVKPLEDKLAALEAEKQSLAAEKQTVTAERDRLAAREAPIFRDNREMKAQIRNLKGELETLKASVASDNAAAIESAVQTRLAEAAPTPPAPAAPTEEQIAEAAKERVAAAEAQLTAQCDEAIAQAVMDATAPLEQTLETLRAELAAAKAAVAEATPTGALGELKSNADAKQAIADAVEASKKEMEAEFAKVKDAATAEAVKKEKEAIERLTVALRKAQQQASAAAAAAPSSAPPPNIDAIVKEKLVAIEKERTASQQQAIETAVNEALKKQKEEHEKLLKETREQIEKQAQMKNALLQKTVNGLRARLDGQQPKKTEDGGAAKPAASAAPAAASPPALTPAAATAAKPAPTPTASFKPAQATPAAAAQPAAAPQQPQVGTSAGRGGGAAAGRGGRGGAARGRGGAARGGKGAASPPASSNAQAAGSGAARTPGGVLGSILGRAAAANASQAAGAKRARESDGDAAGQGGTGGDQAKRPKGA